VARNIVLNKVLAGRCINPIERSKTQAYRMTRTNTLKEADSLSFFKETNSPKSNYSSKLHL